ncbi:hexamerin-like [Schistocerca gregaria]|uniref:hexamerin-like n=1 Tax=Schistocerca gregaria TaxID=7010 RepID=UPI00211EAB34|nr:hexamerin-like [Schistocerca gregaria]
MKTTAVALLTLLAFAAADPEEQGCPENDKVQLTRQKDVLRLLSHTNQPLLWEDMAAIAKDYEVVPQNYQVPHVAEMFVGLLNSEELLAVYQPISVFDDRHVDQIKLVFDLLYYANDYDVFYKTALYLRERVNKGQFLVAFFMAVRLREDTRDLILPPIYEIHPELFMTSDVIQRVYDAKLQGYVSADKPYYVLAGYTGFPVATHSPEQMLTYFTEDVGLNEFFADFNYRYPYFLSAANYSMSNGNLRGTLFYRALRQLFARYNLERLSHGLPDVATLDYSEDIETSYNPKLRLQNGVEIAMRPAKLNLVTTDVLALERIWYSEYRLFDVVDMEHIVTATEGRITFKESEATELLGNLVQCTPDSLNARYYGSYYKDLLSLIGKNLNPAQRYGGATSVLSKFETMLRDPLYFQIVKRVLNIFQQYQNYLEPYTRQELEFPGVKIESVDVEKLVTFFESYDIEVDNTLKVSSAEEAEKVKIFAQQPRLNHKPFTYCIKVSSEKPTKAIFRVFYGPQVNPLGNEIPLDYARQYFLEFDRFVYQVQAGENVIERNSSDAVSTRPDSVPTSQLVEAVEAALQGKRDLWPAGVPRRGFPGRLLLPRGRRAGLPLRLYVIASPLAEDAPAAALDPRAPLAGDWGVALADGRPVDFPFDRRIPYNHVFNVPNSYTKNVLVFHVDVVENIKAED